MNALDWRGCVPPIARRAAGDLRASRARSDVTSELRRLARTPGPIIAGPWLGEVGFEILYWVPFLKWAVEAAGLDPARVVAVSRGGPRGWYQQVAGQYADVFDYFSLDQFRDGNVKRRLALGEQKQLRATEFDDAVMAALTRESGREHAEVLHPSLMYRLYRPYWWKHKGLDWVKQHASYERVERPPFPEGLPVKSGEYVAAKFYANDCVPDSAEVHRLATEVLSEVSKRYPVVLLDTGADVDDHAASGGAFVGHFSVKSMVNVRNNLDVQSAVVAHARAVIGTYGGFSYLAPFYGVPAAGFYVDADGFDGSHLALANDVFSQLDVRYDVCPLRDAPGFVRAFPW